MTTTVNQIIVRKIWGLALGTSLTEFSWNGISVIYKTILEIRERGENVQLSL